MCETVARAQGAASRVLASGDIPGLIMNVPQIEPSYIQGEWWADSQSGHFDSLNPADVRDVVARYPIVDAKGVAAAVDAAVEASAEWAGLGPIARGRFLFKVADSLDADRERLAQILTRQEGKTLGESRGEVQRAAEIFRYYGGLGWQLGGQTLPFEPSRIEIRVQPEPVGVVALITPWNFPIAIPAWKLAPALLAGNTVVLKPSELAPQLALELCRLFQKVGLPRGVLNCVTGPGNPTGAALVGDPRVDAVSFTGSHGVGLKVQQSAGPRLARVQLEMGGKNATIVLGSADLKLAADLIVRSAFGLSGQACTATSRVIAVREIAGELQELIRARSAALVVGPGAEAGVDVGPVVNEAALSRIAGFVDAAQSDGANVVLGGKRLTDVGSRHGCFYAPTLVTDVSEDAPLANEEVFGPVLTYLPVDDEAAAIRLANATPFGLCASVITRDLGAAFRCARQLRVGVVKINQPSTGLALHAPFGGTKASSADAFREQGMAALQFFTRTKTVYLDPGA